VKYKRKFCNADDFSVVLNDFLEIELIPIDNDDETPLVICSIKYVHPNQVYLFKKPIHLNIKSFV